MNLLDRLLNRDFYWLAVALMLGLTLTMLWLLA